MNEESEIGWLRLADKSHLVLTKRHVFQQRDSGIFGESRATIPRDAIISVRISWQRSRALVALGAILIVMFLFLLIASITEGPAGISRWDDAFNAYPSWVSFIEYGSLVGGIGMFVLFGIYKRNQIEILAPSVSLGGVPRSYDEAEQFYTLLVADSKEQSQIPKKNKSDASSGTTATDHDWRL